MPSPSNPPDTLAIRRARPLLGTLVEIRASPAVPGGGQTQIAIDAAFGAIERVHRLMSFHDADSDIARINRDALRGVVTVDAHTWAVLSLGRSIAIDSGGAFDLATGSSLQRRSLLPGLPFETIDDGDCRFDLDLPKACEVRFRRPLRIDVGGIAKGYAVDQAIEVLREASIDGAVVNAGGDLAVIGSQRVGIRDPARPSRIAASVALQDEALATSGSYFASSADRVALVDRRQSAFPSPPFASVSVRAPACALADALTKAVLFTSRPAARQLLNRYGAEAWYLEIDANAANVEASVPC